jgi:lipopolysaccharide/colanic/teichoic acid biosynthesis glycosyltransferase
MSIEERPVVSGGVIVLAKDPFQDADPLRTSLVRRVITVVGMLVIVIVIVIVRVLCAIVVPVESTHLSAPRSELLAAPTRCS